MSDETGKPSAETLADAEREILRQRTFTANEALARMAGPGAMKGASPVSMVQQAETEIGSWLRANVADSTGILQALLNRHLKGSELLLNHLDRPLHALATYCQQLLASDQRLVDLVREADADWGRAMGERPYFNLPGAPPHPDDPYTVDSVRAALSELFTKIGKARDA